VWFWLVTTPGVLWALILFLMWCLGLRFERELSDRVYFVREHVERVRPAWEQPDGREEDERAVLHMGRFEIRRTTGCRDAQYLILADGFHTTYDDFVCRAAYIRTEEVVAVTYHKKETAGWTTYRPLLDAGRKR
jgi:hypothetical protein